MNQHGNVNFDSVILAGGFGKRLAPLTDTIPKPMLPIANKSSFIRILELLRKNGFMNTAVTTMHLHQQIENVTFNEGHIEFIHEESPMGSAGAIGALKSKFEDYILVISGDAICDFDLNSARDEFIKSGCDAAILLTRSNEAGEYGSVCLSSGRITELCEKPSVRDTLSDLINTGIYFLSKNALNLIPQHSFYDFSRDLFPTMMEKRYVYRRDRAKGQMV